MYHQIYHTNNNSSDCMGGSSVSRYWNNNNRNQLAIPMYPFFVNRSNLYCIQPPLFRQISFDNRHVIEMLLLFSCAVTKFNTNFYFYFSGVFWSKRLMRCVTWKISRKPYRKFKRLISIQRTKPHHRWKRIKRLNVSRTHYFDWIYSHSK